MYNLNEYERQRRIAESTKKLYPPGTRMGLCQYFEIKKVKKRGIFTLLIGVK